MKEQSVVFPEVMSVVQAAEYLGTSRHDLYARASGGTVPAFKLGGRWRFSKKVLERWMEKQIQERSDGHARAELLNTGEPQ